MLVLVALVVLDYADAVSEFAPFPGQLKGLALPLVEALGIGPVNVSASDAVERGDSVTRTPAGPVPLRIYDRYPCIDWHAGSSALVSAHVKRVCAISGLGGRAQQLLGLLDRQRLRGSALMSHWRADKRGHIPAD